MGQHAKVLKLVGWSVLFIGLMAVVGPAQVIAWLIFGGFILYVMVYLALVLQNL